MPPLTDNELLDRFAMEKDGRAFELLVERHLGLVLGAARRRLPGREPLAEEVAQNVFVTLAGKSGALRRHSCLPAWLHKTTAYEAMRAARKESNHAKKMKHWHTEAMVERSVVAGGDDAMEEALPLLDDAIAALGESDRRALLMRFYEGKSFKAIAAQVGKNEAACQKQARRAVAKLADLLRRRGVAISATVLASGLGVEFGKAAPVVLSKTIAQSALSKAGTAAGTFSIPLVTMSTKSAVTAAAILIACMGAGYVAGHSAKPPVVPLEAGDEPELAEPLVAKALPEPPKLEVAKVIADPEAEMDLLRELLGFARDELRSSGDDLMAGARGRARIARIPYEMIPAALELVAAMPGGFDVETELADALISRWAEVDGLAACDFSFENRTPLGFGRPPVSAPLKSWATHNPQAALDWYLARRAEKHPGLQEERVNERRVSHIGLIFGVWGRTDLDGALAALQEIGNRQLRRSAMYGVSTQAGPLEEREKLFDLVAAWPDLGREALGSVLPQHSGYRTEGVAQWLDEHPNEVYQKDQKLAMLILRNWLLVDSEAAAEWWITRPRDQALAPHMRELISMWRRSDDIGKPAAWLASQELDDSHAITFPEFSMQMARKAPERALEWVSELDQSEFRAQAVRTIVDTWSGWPPEKVNAFVDANDIDEAVKAKVLEMLDNKRNS